MLTSSELISLVQQYEPNANADLLRKAYVFAIEAHGIQKRASGSPYFYHPAEVARILAELKLDIPTIVTGLLHDVLEDTNVSFEELEEIFGSEIAFLVAGVTKLSKINYTSSKTHQADNFRKFLLAISQDIRVLIVKLVDRLHNMRTLNYIASIDKRKRIALETLDIYAPLAERIGMNAIKDEIEDIAFYNLHPNEYSAISLKLEQIRSKDNNFVQNTILELQKIFEESKLEASISGREKKVYSIWKKMQRRNVSLEQINDIIAFRVIVKTIEQCYLALGIIHTHYQIMPGRFKDYISIPKLNNYRSLHTTVIGPFKQPIEVQIRTEEMHRIADEGVAAHWAYKEGSVVVKDNDPKKYSWIKSLLTVLKNSGSPEEVMDNSKLEMFEDEVFCFTPNGDLITLPRGATAVDFAYSIHTAIGNTCIGVRLNGKMAPLKTVLRNGDQVDILTSPYQHPEASWERFVVTGKAKACIRRFIKSQERAEFIALGLQLVKYVFSMTNIVFNESMIDFKKFSCETIAKFYYNVGKCVIPLNSVRSIIPEQETPPFMNANAICLIDFTPGIAVHFAECCHPILGDKIIGILVPQKGIVVHLTNCDRIEQENCTFIKVKWNQDDDIDAAFIARLRIVILNKPESFAIITNIISSNGAGIANIKVEHRSVDFFDLLIDVKVDSPDHLGELQAALRACANVRSVRRL
ncbi:MAG: bifunctional (p)ppGpp synthetase/guanosine-3',5'-bis(diphosphate) 3'-pyrophosphohydrolase [Alphaproteobacteria bacterium]|nr:bifunctional (p)ppGpp synthetase/guanosine-3',5'-bis(diphosphate) 3'-pyrophosphohydrolase [Alphaproteobacteria bacterium]